MKQDHNICRYLTSLVRTLAILSFAISLGSCSLDHGFLNSAGPIASEQREIFIIVTWVMVFVGGPVILLVPLFAWHYRLSNTSDAYRPQWVFSWLLEGFIWIPPILIVLGLSVLVWHYTHSLDPYRPLAGGVPIEIDTVALDWKWLFIHRKDGIAEVNRLVIPVGQPVHLRLTSGTVMQSILIPRLAGQIYAMGGMTTNLNLRADAAGEYRGENTQFNGEGFSKQSFVVVAMESADYVAWRSGMSAAAPFQPADVNTLLKREVPTRKAVYSRVPEDLFEQIIARISGIPAHGMGAH